MEKDIKKPQIRFQGFTEEWEQRKLSEIAEIITGTTPPTDDKSNYDGNKLFVSPIDIQGNRYVENTITTLSEKGFKLGRELKPGTVLFVSIGSTIGKVAQINDFATTNQQINAIFPNNEMDCDFVFSLIENESKNIKKLSAQQAVPIINKTTFGNIEILFPKKNEQIAIGEFFKKLDNLISLHQRKYHSLVKVKKSMLEKMFPRRGTKKPEIRFAGFTDDWEQRKLKDIVIIERGGSPRPIESFITNSENGLNWVKIGDAPEQGNYITKTKEKIKPEGLTKTREVHPGDLILSNSMSFGKPYIMGIDGCIHDGWLLIRDVNKIFDLKYLCCMLGTEQMLSQYKSMAAGSTVNNLNKELVGNTIIKYPNKNEQKQIGAFFDKIDNLITLHQRKLNLLKNMKKAMLEKMFV